MSILIDKNTQVLVQGSTGKEGAKATKAMLDYHTNVVCGVTPNKGGQEVEGKPVFNTVKEALSVIASHSEAIPLDGSANLGIAASPLAPRNDNIVSAIYV